MKNALQHGAQRAPSVLRAGPANAKAPTVRAAHLHWALSELADLTRALAITRQQAHAALEHVQTLTERNSQLERELVEVARREAQVREFAYHDELTGLPNRRLLLDRLKQAVAQAARQHRQVVLLSLDLDGFKSVNDRLGHAGGDQLLRSVARRLTDGIRGADTACRYGGDEFLIMLPEVDNPAISAAVWTKLKLALDQPHIIDGYQVHLTASMGSVVYPTDGQSHEELIRRADSALYRAKARSGNALIRALPRETPARADPKCPASSRQPGTPGHNNLDFLRQLTGTLNQR